MKIMIIQKILMVSLAVILYHLIGNDGILLGIAFAFIPFYFRHDPMTTTDAWFCFVFCF